MHHHQLFDEKSDWYASSRPVYPDALFSCLVGLCPATRQAWDCATGAGVCGSSECQRAVQMDQRLLAGRKPPVAGDLTDFTA
ncbi:hypothetical protein ACFQAT_19425 [Undibacterium arcticum]